MVFSSSLFLLYFFPLFLVLYYAIDVRYKNAFALFASILFYTWGAPRFVFVVLSSILVDFFLVQWIHSATGKKKRLLLFVSVFLNLGLLGYFKYANFFVENVNGLLSHFGVTSISWTLVALPIGISFFTFKKLSYCIDVYRDTHKPFTSIRDYALFILLFPELIAGPIVRFNQIADQIEDRQDRETADNKMLGFFRLIIGLSKKVLIANVLGNEVDKIFAMDAAAFNTPLAWLGIIAYSFQIYFDFSGYSDMAIGIARMIGFTFPENFDNPYTSLSITEFWRRWHMTLSTWLNEYLFAPVYTGLRYWGMAGLVFSLFITFFLSGLWHGAGWTFVVFGIMHGIGVIYDALTKKGRKKVSKKLPPFLYNGLSLFFTYCYVLIAWVFFRSETLANAFSYIKKMFAFDFKDSKLFFYSDFWFILLLAVLFSFSGKIPAVQRFQAKVLFSYYSTRAVIVMSLICLFLLLISLSCITASGFNPFIYFRF